MKTGLAVALLLGGASALADESPWHRFSDAGLLTEDVSYSARDESLYVSSVLQHRVIRVDARGIETQFPLEPPERDWNVLGVQVDAKRGIVWVSAAAMQGFPGIRDEDAGKSRISAYGLKSKRRLYSHEFPPGAKPAAIGDLALTPRGDLIASDSQGGKVYRISADRRTIGELGEDFRSPQDAAVRDDGRVAFIADYPRGIARIDLETGEQTWLEAEPSIALGGIDGLYLHRGHLVAVQNGTQPERIAYLTLDAGQHRVVRCEVLVSGASLGEVTHGVVLGDDFVYLANAGWDKLDAHGAPRPGESLTPAELRRLALPR